jgi:hypothetical protein
LQLSTKGWFVNADGQYCKGFNVICGEKYAAILFITPTILKAKIDKGLGMCNTKRKKMGFKKASFSVLKGGMP